MMNCPFCFVVVVVGLLVSVSSHGDQLAFLLSSTRASTQRLGVEVPVSANQDQSATSVW